MVSTGVNNARFFSFHAWYIRTACVCFFCAFDRLCLLKVSIRLIVVLAFLSAECSAEYSAEQR